MRFGINGCGESMYRLVRSSMRIARYSTSLWTFNPGSSSCVMTSYTEFKTLKTSIPLAWRETILATDDYSSKGSHAIPIEHGIAYILSTLAYRIQWPFLHLTTTFNITRGASEHLRSARKISYTFAYACQPRKVQTHIQVVTYRSRAKKLQWYVVSVNPHHAEDSVQIAKLLHRCLKQQTSDQPPQYNTTAAHEKGQSHTRIWKRSR